MNDETARALILSTIMALAESKLHRSWIVDGFFDAAKVLGLQTEFTSDDLHEVHKNARKALKALYALRRRCWGNEEIQFLASTFIENSAKK